MHELPKLLVVDDDRLIRRTLNLALKDEYRITAVSSGEDAIRIARTEVFPLVTLDLCMEGMSGIDTLRTLRQMNESQKILILTGFETLETSKAAVNEGAFKYFCKPVRLPEIKRAIREGYELYRRQSSMEKNRSVATGDLEGSGLTAREEDVFYHMIEGKTNVDIAAALGISDLTVKTHAQKLFTKLRVGNRTELAGKFSHYLRGN